MTRNWQGPLRSLRDMADRTPAHRNRHVDLMRAVAICAVVLGHWLLLVVEDRPNGLHGTTVLAELSWTSPLTWLFQVMPVVFFVGGYANAASLTAHLGRGGQAASWLWGRAVRLLAPTSVLLGVLVCCAVFVFAVRGDTELVALAAWVATMPLWFLAAYMGMVLLAPVTFRLHRRFGLGVVAGLVVGVAVFDLIYVTHVTDTQPESMRILRHLCAWLAVHQAGYCWYDRLLPTRPSACALLAGGGLTGAVLLVTVGPYPVSMVTVPGVEASNAGPPTIPLLALATAQIGMILLLSGPSNRWLRRRRPWTAVVAVNAVVFTVFLWHMSAAVLGAMVLYPTGILPQPPVDSAEWLLLRLPWLGVLAALLITLVALFGWVEARATGVAIAEHLSLGPRVLVPAGMALCIVALILVGLSGPELHGPVGIPLGLYALYLIGVLMVYGTPRIARALR
ncbi:acyltransferase [Lipingzhangella sp. LS1_29]|uniref:Acyltransferase n=1 Tax=Lipingzhangella rawalii TaxID=2055835 RepID=A0ABU2H7K1_9ACTN|nr:acyltransferase [Lipingzhangella rawalii]MDS1271288.1 acyltransferase [Lipingzhangella rawalii]